MGATIKKRKMYEGFLEKVPILGTVPLLLCPLRVSPLASLSQSVHHLLSSILTLSLSLCPFQRRSTTGRGSLSPTRWSRRSTTTAR
jgi:hypothetical protein